MVPRPANKFPQIEVNSDLEGAKTANMAFDHLELVPRPENQIRQIEVNSCLESAKLRISQSTT